MSRAQARFFLNDGTEIFDDNTPTSLGLKDEDTIEVLMTESADVKDLVLNDDDINLTFDQNGKVEKVKINRKRRLNMAFLSFCSKSVIFFK